MELTLIDNYYQVVDNANQYVHDIKELPDLQQLMGQYVDWYYIPVNGQFGPPDFLGYQNMTGAWYLYYRRDDPKADFKIDTVEKVLRKFFEPVPKDYAAVPALERELELFLGRFNQKPRQDHRIFIPV